MSGNTTNAHSNNTLSPYDFSGLGMGFGLYRPRRPSYTFATQCNRQRSESYRYATRRENPDSTSEVSSGEDFIEDVLRNKTRKVSYLKATTQQEVSSQTSPKVSKSVRENDDEAVSDDEDLKGETQADSEASPIKEPEVLMVTLNNHTPVLQYSTDDDAMCESQNYINHKCAAHRKIAINHVLTPHNGQDQHREDLEVQQQPLAHRTTNHLKERNKYKPPHRKTSVIAFSKNLIVLCFSFILVFSSFGAIQNLQASINSEDNLGILTMMTVHISMIFACLVAPIIINIFTAKWALCIGILCFLIWFGANFYPTFYTLIPTSLFVGFGQGILWNAEGAYILKLAFDSARATRGHLEREMFRFHGIFLACFQTTHIWGNLISSLLLFQRANEISDALDLSGAQGAQIYYDYEEPFYPSNNSYGDYNGDYSLMEEGGGLPTLPMSQCGALHRCGASIVHIFPGTRQDQTVLAPVLWKLMTSYIVLGVVSFGLIIVLLDRIGARADPEKNPRQIIFQHIRQLVQHKTMRLLTPLLLFNGMQQGFIYSDYNYYFVTCTLGVHYVGYCMITLGAANVLGAIFVALFSHKIPREVVLGFGGIVHIALMIGYLIWIPERRPVLFFVLAAAWGVCDSVWQTQCNTLICLTCMDSPEVAFTNYRLVQSIGLAIMFGCGTWMCVSAKLYMLMTLLVVSIMFYVMAEYRLRHDEDEVFEEP